MPRQLTWDDLLIRDFTPEDAQHWLDPWHFLLAGQVAPVYLSRFGDWFLRRPDGSVDELSVLEGTLRQIARTPEEFESRLNSQEWQERHLLSFLVHQLHERGLVPGPGECYGFAPHPVLSGRIDLESAVIMPAGAWQAACAQLFARAFGAAAPAELV